MGDDFEVADFKSNQIAPCHMFPYTSSPAREARGSAELQCRGVPLLVLRAVSAFLLSVGNGAAECRDFGVCLRLTQCSQEANHRAAAARTAPNPSGRVLRCSGLVGNLPNSNSNTFV